jgi:hypothetical protein
MDAARDPVAANPVAAAIDGATGDWSMSGDAMRWSPELAEQGPVCSDLPGLDVAVGIGAGLGLDMESVRRLVTGALTSLGAVATDVVTEFRSLTRGPPNPASSDGEDWTRAGAAESSRPQGGRGTHQPGSP